MAQPDVVVCVAVVVAHPTLPQVLLTRSTKGRGVVLPGGRCESGELPVAAAIRETREETGLAVAPLAWLCDKEGELPDGRRFVCEVYAATTAADGPLIAGDDAAEAFWGPPSLLNEGAFPGDAPIAAKWLGSLMIVRDQLQTRRG